MPTNAFPSTVTQVDTAARFPLGYEVTVPAKGAGTTADQGEQVWVYVFNDETSDAFAQGHIVMRDAATATYDAVLTGAGALEPAIRVIGVAQHAIAAGSYGFVLKRGIGEITAGAGAGLTANVGVTSAGTTNAGTGLIAAASAAAAICVIAVATETVAANAKATCWINCPG